MPHKQNDCWQDVFKWNDCRQNECLWDAHRQNGYRRNTCKQHGIVQNAPRQNVSPKMYIMTGHKMTIEKECTWSD